MYYTVDGAVVPLSKPVNWYPKPANGSEPGRGTINNDSFNSQAGETMFGSLGDDTYNLWQNSAAVIEKFAEGVDTIYGRYWGGVILPDNVENLLLISGGANFGFGNNLGNLIVAGNAGAKLDGRAGNDVLVGGEGDDVFVVAKGNGSDAIINFTPGRDTILLQGQGYAEWSDLTARMHQTGADVTLHTSIEEDVIIRGIALADLDAADFGMLLPNKASPAQAGLLNGAQKSAYDNGWYVLNNAWGAKAFVEGDDYNINTIFDPKDLTAGTTFNWRFPVSDPGEPMKVLAYPEIIFGVSPHGDQSSNRTVVLPIQLEDLASFRVDYDVDYNGSNGFNVAFDIWFTSEPYGDASKITNEVMIWVHKGDFDPYGDVIGTYSKDGFTAKIYHQGTYTAVVADGDLLTANIDVADIIGVLSELGVISSSEYLASIELGAEVSGGAGSLTVKNLDLTVEERAPAGGILTHKVSGAGVETLYEPDLDVPAGAEPAVDWQAVYAADGTISGYLGVERQNEGTTLTTHYAVDHHITGSTLTRVKPDGAVLTIEYDAAGAEAGSKLVVARGNDVTRTYHYDKTGELTGSVVHDPHASDGSRNVSYDSSGKFVSCEVTSLSGSITMVTHYDADWKASSRMMSGSSSDDAIYGGKSINVMRGGAGNDTLVGNENADVLIGGLGTDHLRGAGGADRFVFEQMKEMGAKSDTADLIADFNASEGDLIDLTGIDANLLLAGHQSFAFVGTKPIAPRAGSLWVEPGSRADWEIKGDVNGDGSADFAISVRASNGEQIMEGAIVGASLASGPRDVVVEEAGGLRTIHYDAAGMIIGSDLAVGNRTVYYDANNILLRSTITDRDGAGNDRLIIYGSRNELLGAKVTYYRQDGVRIDTQYDAMWKVTSRTSEGTGGDDTVYSGIGENILIGEDGNDTLAGNNGDDVLIGGKGADRLKGAGGADRFVFEEISDLSATRGTSDQILDFSAGQGDRIDLSGLDANLLIEGDQAFTFFRSAPSTPSAGALWIEAISTKNVNLLGDIDGDGSADFLIHVTSIVVETLPHSGFIL